MLLPRLLPSLNVFPATHPFRRPDHPAVRVCEWRRPWPRRFATAPPDAFESRGVVAAGAVLSAIHPLGVRTRTGALASPKPRFCCQCLFCVFAIFSFLCVSLTPFSPSTTSIWSCVKLFSCSPALCPSPPPVGPRRRYAPLFIVMLFLLYQFAAVGTILYARVFALLDTYTMPQVPATIASIALAVYLGRANIFPATDVSHTFVYLPLSRASTSCRPCLTPFWSRCSRCGRSRCGSGGTPSCLPAATPSDTASLTAFILWWLFSSSARFTVFLFRVPLAPPSRHPCSGSRWCDADHCCLSGYGCSAVGSMFVSTTLPAPASDWPLALTCSRRGDPRGGHDGRPAQSHPHAARPRLGASPVLLTSPVPALLQPGAPHPPCPCFAVPRAFCTLRGPPPTNWPPSN